MPAHQHGGAPARVVSNAHVGPYDVSVWTAAGVGMSTVYVVYRPHDGAAFVAPSSVRLAVAPQSGRLAATTYIAHPETVRHGARFVAHVTFDRAEPWQVRIITNEARVADVRAPIMVTEALTPGPTLLALYTLPFVLVAAIWTRAAIVRHRVALRVALTPSSVT